MLKVCEINFYCCNCATVELSTGDCGFNPSFYTVECDLIQVVHTHLPLSPGSIIVCQCKLGSKQAHHVTL